MKKLLYIISLALCITMTSCRDTAIDDSIKKRIEDAVKTSDIIMSSSDDNINNIISPYYTVNDNKYYFEVKKQGETKGVSILAYIDLNANTKAYICSDPLCKHTNQQECKYSDFRDIYFAGDNIFYSLRGVNSVASTRLYRVDISEDKAERVYAPQNDMLSAIGAYDGKFYFWDIKEIIVNDLVQYRYELKSLDSISGELYNYGFIPDEYVDANADIFFIKDNKFFFCAIDRVFVTDTDFNNENLIITTTGNDYLGEWYYDKETDELYFNVRNQEKNTGSVYRYHDGEAEKISLAHDEIYYFTLTDKYIYYSSYDPIYYGISAVPGNPEVYDYTGGKIYKSDRYNTNESSLVLDCGDDYVICRPPSTNYIIIGNMLYFTQGEIVHEGEYTYFSKAENVTKVCIDLTTGATDTITFE